MVGAGEGVVDGLVLHDHCAVVGHDVAVEVVDGGLVLEEGRRQLGCTLSLMMELRILGKMVNNELVKKEKKRLEKSWAWWHMPVTPVLGRWRGAQGKLHLHGEFEASLNYMKPCLKI